MSERFTANQVLEELLSDDFDASESEESDYGDDELCLAMETEEERRARLENDAATKQLRFAMDTDEERKARLKKMVDTTQLRLTLETVEETRAKK